MSDAFMPPSRIRDMFSAALSAMYRAEVPAYGDLLDIVADVNADLSRETGASLNRISRERHGAIRLGTADELSKIARLFAVIGMEPVGYYDLSVAGLPVHSTAFRPTAEAALEANPFRVFTSLLRLELIEDAELREAAEVAMARRNIVSDKALEMIGKAEADGGLNARDAEIFVGAALETFRWRDEANVDYGLYQKLLAAHGLIADIVCFKGPHINHLTPRVLDIDIAQGHMAALSERGGKIVPKASIEGPPTRNCPILLRQTSFKALQEAVRFPDTEGGFVDGMHTARFGEIEQRGAALTPKGRALYDKLLAQSKTDGLQEAFTDFPDDWEALRKGGYIYVRYSLTEAGKAAGKDSGQLEELLRDDLITYEPIIYEDFLPVSAAGIFRSNLDAKEDETQSETKTPDKAAFEAALGRQIHDPFALYADIQDRSEAAVLGALGR